MRPQDPADDYSHGRFSQAIDHGDDEVVECVHHGLDRHRGRAGDVWRVRSCGHCGQHDVVECKRQGDGGQRVPGLELRPVPDLLLGGLDRDVPAVAEFGGPALPLVHADQSGLRRMGTVSVRS